MPSSPQRPPERLIDEAAPLSRYLTRLLGNPPGCFHPAMLLAPLGTGEIRSLLDGFRVDDETSLRHALRQVRQAAMMRLIVRDLTGLADVHEVMTSTTALAEVCTRFALTHLQNWTQAVHGAPVGAAGEAIPFLVIGMGKLGGGELNVSSDIDLVFLYPDDGETHGPRPLSANDYFTRLGRKLIAALSEHTADGQVFRVDMRLRPYGDSGPLVMNFAMLEGYLLTQGREWERYAWIKAREITGQPVDELTQLVTPFVYRRHLDYSAIASLRELHAQIRAEVARRELHDNIKLGPGGIREIEFIAQVFQLVRGGRDAGLRVRPTLLALERLAERGLLPSEAGAQLRGAYAFLRNLEHRLQYLDDAQTQMLPRAAEDRLTIARGMGCASTDELLGALERCRADVTRQFEAIFARDANQPAEHPLAALWLGRCSGEEGLARLAALGYADAAAILARMAEMRQGSRYRSMAATSQGRVDRLVPRLLEVAAQFERPDQTLERLVRVLESIGRRESYLALLLEYPAALRRLTAIAAASPWASDYLASHPILLDELISEGGMQAPDWPALAVRLTADLEAVDNVEQQMDLLRHFKQVQTLRLLSLDLAGNLPLETLSDHLSDLACLILRQVLRLAWLAMRGRHRDEPRFAVIGYGKLGGKELGYASDLDIIFLYDDEHADAAQQYARLAQRMNTWLTSLTPAGVLYETDLRLRPDGASGLLVSRFAAYEEYQRHKAWVWEHQALTRARFVAGDEAIGARFEQLRTDILRMPRDTGALAHEVAAMRKRMLDGHPNRSALFDLKHDRGGIVDVEFIVQYLVLAHAHAHAGLTGNIGNLALLRLAGKLGLIDAGLAGRAHHAYREFRRMQHGLRLQGERYARVHPTEVAGLAEPVMQLWEAVLDGR